MKASETQIAGQHYKDFPIQPAEFCQRNRLNWCEANVVKYTCRHAKKNGLEDLRKAMHYLELLAEFEYGEPLNPSEDVTPLNELYLHGTLCDTCARPDCAKGEYPATKDGGCEGYLRADSCPKCSHVSDQCAEYRQPDLPCGDFSAKDAPTAAERPAVHTDPAVNCKDCCSAACMGSGLNVTLDQGCDGFTSKEGSSGFNLTLPPIMLKCNLDEIQRKFTEEMKELRETEHGSMEELIEAWDCIQVAQTYREHNGREDYADASGVADSLREWHGQGRPVMQAKRAMLVKNAARAMYSDHVNAAILATL